MATTTTQPAAEDTEATADPVMPSIADLKAADAMRKIFMARHRKPAAERAKAAFDKADVPELTAALNALKETHSNEAVSQAIGVWVQIITEAQKNVSSMIDQAQQEGWPKAPAAPK
jgi:hypothetical protein